MNKGMVAILLIADALLLGGWAYFEYGDTADVIGAASVGVVLIVCGVILVQIVKLRRR